MQFIYKKSQYKTQKFGYLKSKFFNITPAIIFAGIAIANLPKTILKKVKAIPIIYKKIGLLLFIK